MHAIIFFITIGLCLTLLAAHGIVAPPNLIEVQEQSNFDKWTKDTEHKRAALVYWYAGYSPICKNFLREYKKVAEFYNHGKYGEAIMILKVDGPNHHQLARSLKIEAFPTLFLYSTEEYGKYEKYEGELEAEEIISWVNKKLHPKMKRDGVAVPKRKPKRRALL